MKSTHSNKKIGSFFLLTILFTLPAYILIALTGMNIILSEEMVFAFVPLSVIAPICAALVLTYRESGKIGVKNTSPIYNLHVGDGNISATNASNTRMAVTDNTNGERAAILGLAKTGGGAKVEAQLEAVMSVDSVISVNVINPGEGYAVLPEIRIAPAE